MVPLDIITHVRPFCNSHWCSLAAFLTVHHGCCVGSIPLESCSFLRLFFPCMLIFLKNSGYQMTLRVLPVILYENHTIPSFQPVTHPHMTPKFVTLLCVYPHGPTCWKLFLSYSLIHLSIHPIIAHFWPSPISSKPFSMISFLLLFFYYCKPNYAHTTPSLTQPNSSTSSVKLPTFS